MCIKLTADEIIKIANALKNLNHEKFDNYYKRDEIDQKIANETKNYKSQPQIEALIDIKNASVIQKKVKEYLDGNLSTLVKIEGEKYKQQNLVDIHTLQNNRYKLNAYTRSVDKQIATLKYIANLTIGITAIIIFFTLCYDWFISYQNTPIHTTRHITETAKTFTTDTTKISIIDSLTARYEKIENTRDASSPEIAESDYSFLVFFLIATSIIILITTIISSQSTLKRYKENIVNNTLYTDNELKAFIDKRLEETAKGDK